MEIIHKADHNVIKILSNFKNKSDSYRLLKYCIVSEVDDGILLYNLLTKEMLFLNNEEYIDILALQYLRDNFFLIPDNTSDIEYADLVKLIFRRNLPKYSEITGYTIFPTTDCNARCFYCYEMGRSRINMSQSTALKIVDFINKRCAGKKVVIRWFGGEPLYNYNVINTICEGLKAKGVLFKSIMISNGYLFDEKLIDLAKNSWKLDNIQISLDGTEKVYNKIKAYIYEDVNPYKIVLNNIEKLLKNSIKVTVRLNFDVYNAEDILSLIDELAFKFGKYTNFTVYAHYLFKEGIPLGEYHSDSQWKIREDVMNKISNKLNSYSLLSSTGLPSSFRAHQCMADSGKDITILPDGNIGLCEHFSESEFIGHIDRDEFDLSDINEWRELVPLVQECYDCFYYPECFKLKKCSNATVCFEQFRVEKRRSIINRMLIEYKKWKIK